MVMSKSHLDNTSILEKVEDANYDRQITDILVKCILVLFSESIYGRHGFVSYESVSCYPCISSRTSAYMTIIVIISHTLAIYVGQSVWQ
jgi:hypothetical protein